MQICIDERKIHVILYFEQYIFEGVSHLVASIIIGCVQHIRRMNENGVKKMCRNIFSLQQTLTNITLAREPALDHARQYFELLCLTPEVCLVVLNLSSSLRFSVHFYCFVIYFNRCLK